MVMSRAKEEGEEELERVPEGKESHCKEKYGDEQTVGLR
jgi:hypothetical protein